VASRATLGSSAPRPLGLSALGPWRVNGGISSARLRRLKHSSRPRPTSTSTSNGTFYFLLIRILSQALAHGETPPPQTAFHLATARALVLYTFYFILFCLPPRDSESSWWCVCYTYTHKTCVVLILIRRELLMVRVLPSIGPKPPSGLLRRPLMTIQLFGDGVGSACASSPGHHPRLISISHHPRKV